MEKVQSGAERPRARVHALYDAPLSGADIEARSFEAIEREACRSAFTADEWAVVRRMVHTTGDVSITRLARFSPDAVEAGVAALRRGSPLYVDSRMIASGLSMERLRSACPAYGPGHVSCHVADEDVAAEARRHGLPRSLFALRKARGVIEGGVVVIGNAPVALLELNRLVMEEGVRPALVIGMPVGFVHVVESKDELMGLPVPWIVLAGRRGGSPVGVSVVHALCALAREGAAQANQTKVEAEMSRAIILMGHGSRVQAAGEAMERVAERLKERHGHALLESCYMSMRGPTLGEAFDRCVAQGATEVVVIPYFLHAGLHIRVDIPRMLQERASRHPGVRVVLGPHLGFDDALVDLVARRLEEAARYPDVREIDVPSEEAVAGEETGR